MAFCFTPRSISPGLRTGGGSKGGWRGVDTELYIGGGIPFALHQQKSCKPPKKYKGNYMMRQDLMYNIRKPSAGAFGSQMNGPASTNNMYMRQIQESGVRPTNPAHTIGAHSGAVMTKRPQLVKICEHCYYWTDGLVEYNLCTKHNKGHWHKKTAALDPTEGYRPMGRMGGARNHRSNHFMLPIHRLGTDHPRKGGASVHWGNPHYGSFDPWLTLRRFHAVGRKDQSKRYSFQHIFHQEL